MHDHHEPLPLNDAPSKLRDAASSATSAVREAANSVGTSLKTAGVEADSVASAAKEQAFHLQELLETEIKKRPWQAVTVAAVFGLWLGLRR